MRAGSGILAETLCALVVTTALFSVGSNAGRLIDPWETHYAEVGRAVLERGDPVRLTWQRESFRSKPPLTPWLIALGLRAHGLAERGGYDGELARERRTTRAVRLPFAVAGGIGCAALFFLVATFARRRTAWLATLILASMPLYSLAAMQAITDMPMIATTMVAIALFARLGEVDDGRSRSAWLALGAVAAAVVAQIAVFGAAAGPAAWSLPILAIATLWRPTRHRAIATAAWIAVALAVVAKGPAGLLVAGTTMATYVVATGRWRMVRSAHLLSGVVIVAGVAGPWHLAMFAVDGWPWVEEYLGYHWLGRALDGVHGDRGGAGYYLSVLALGLGPWIGACSLGALTGPERGSRGRLHLLAVCWSVSAFVSFTLIETKFHHYVAPALGGLAIAAALLIENLERGGRRRRVLVATLLAAGAALCALRLVGEPESLLELVIYRHDRPWPWQAPWSLDWRPAMWIAVIASAVVAGAVGIAPRQARPIAALTTAGSALALATYLGGVSPHWGQGELIGHYTSVRRFRGIELTSDATGGCARAEVAPPRDLMPGSAATLTVPNQSLAARVVAVFADAVWIATPNRSCRRLAPGRALTDPLLAWQLLWRGENLWTSGAIFPADPARRTVFTEGDPSRFLAFVRGAAPGALYVMTERKNAAQLRGVLSVVPGTLRELVPVSNKFALFRFDRAASSGLEKNPGQASRGRDKR